MRYGILCATMATTLYASTAIAQPNVVGWKGVPEGIRIGCDTLQQLKDIAEAGKISLDAWGLKFKEYHDAKDSLGEPTCMVGPIDAEVTYKEEVDLGIIPLSGHNEHVWAVEAVAGKTDFWIMFEEPAGTSI
jgi:hypothetical protein